MSSRDLSETDGSHEDIHTHLPQFKNIINLESFEEKVSPQHDTFQAMLWRNFFFFRFLQKSFKVDKRV